MFDLEANIEFQKKSKEQEFYETPLWAARRILDYELLTARVLDPCAGRGVLGNALYASGYDIKNIVETDLNVWPNQPNRIVTSINFLNEDVREELWPMTFSWAEHDFSVIMNPPFSKACEFVEKSFKLGARKILMFQRFSFLESAARRRFFDDMPPNRIWLCGDRAHCWRGDMPDEDVLDPNGEVIVKGKKGRSTPTAHAWFSWERGHRGAMQVERIYKG